MILIYESTQFLVLKFENSNDYLFIMNAEITTPKHVTLHNFVMPEWFYRASMENA